MQANSDFKDLLRIFNEEDVELLVVGAYAVIHFAEPRYTSEGWFPGSLRSIWACQGSEGTWGSTVSR